MLHGNMLILCGCQRCSIGAAQRQSRVRVHNSLTCRREGQSGVGQKGAGQNGAGQNGTKQNGVGYGKAVQGKAKQGKAR